jgi:hypothetical protein
MSRRYYDVSRRAAKLVRGVAAARRLHPGKTLVVSGVDTDMFWQCWRDRPFLPLGIDQVYLTADTEYRIPQLLKETRVSHYVLPDTMALGAIRRRGLVAYELLPSGGLGNITPFYAARLERKAPRLPAYLDIRDPLSGVHLGQGWWQPEQNHRWMSRQATFELRASGRVLILKGFAPDRRELTVSIDGQTLSPRLLAGGPFEERFPVPATGRPTVTITLAVDRALIIPADGRELGLAFGTAEIVP